MIKNTVNLKKSMPSLEGEKLSKKRTMEMENSLEIIVITHTSSMLNI